MQKHITTLQFEERTMRIGRSSGTPGRLQFFFSPRLAVFMTCTELADEASVVSDAVPPLEVLAQDNIYGLPPDRCRIYHHP